jgi:hypothetical protein
MHEKRKARRQSLTYHAHVLLPDGKETSECTVRDVSELGARILINTDKVELPNEFTLVLSTRGHPQRKCKVVWRKEAEVGVRFKAVFADCQL